MTKAKIPNELSFSITARTALLLGRENISSATVALLELVRNAYDADATEVTIKFRNASKPDGTIEVIDNGHGMDWNDIVKKWMIIGTNNKQISPYSPKGRRKVGEKGIGRFALDRLAVITNLETTTRNKIDNSYRLTINWDKFTDTNKSLEEISHPVEIIENRKEIGTKLYLSGLRDAWSRKDYETLYRDLVVLVPPFRRKITGFKINFDCDEAPDLSGVIENKLTEAAVYKMQCDLTSQGKVKIRIETRDESPDGSFRLFKKYLRPWNDFFDSPAVPSCGPIHFEFYWYLREAPAVKSLGLTLSQLINYLDVYGGVRIYRDGFRVKPYGDPRGTGDWLGLNRRRVGHPEGVRSTKGQWVIAENQVAAGVFISREKNPELTDQTNREGLIVNHAFEDMRYFVLRCIEIFETDRQAYERKKAAKSKPKTLDQTIKRSKNALDSDLKKLQDVIELQPESRQKQILQEVFQKVQNTQSKSLEAIESFNDEEQNENITKLQLLQNTATIGITVSAMGHEVLGTSRNLLDYIDRLTKRINEIYVVADERVLSHTTKIHKYGHILYSVANFAISHIDRDKRTRQKIKVNKVIKDLHDDTLDELCKTNSAVLTLKLGKTPDTYMFPYEIESIIINFVTNSIAAFRRGKTPIEDRKIEIETRYIESNRTIEIVAKDGGPGIPRGDKARIFEIYSTKVDDQNRPTGAGLGLVIVKDIVESNNGKVSVLEHGKIMKGAEFTVLLPVQKTRGRKKE